MARVDEAHLSRARGLLAQSKGRLTLSRLHVLAALLGSDRALTHAEVHERLTGADRVSVYRALEWLVREGFACRSMGGDGVRRYQHGEAAAQHGVHPHFQCDACGTTTCLGTDPAPAIAVPRGYRPASIEVTVHGLCPSCDEPEVNARSRARDS